jgi:hypothetical protein
VYWHVYCGANHRFMLLKDRLEGAGPPGREARYQALIEQFIQVRTSVILPVLEQTRDILVARNHVAMIKESEDGTMVKLAFCAELVVGEEIENSPNSNCISFILDAENSQLQVEVRHIDMPGGAPFCIGKPIEPGKLTKAEVEECVLATLKRVMR